MCDDSGNPTQMTKCGMHQVARPVPQEFVFVGDILISVIMLIILSIVSILFKVRKIKTSYLKKSRNILFVVILVNIILISLTFLFPFLLRNLNEESQLAKIILKILMGSTFKNWTYFLAELILLPLFIGTFYHFVFVKGKKS